MTLREGSFFSTYVVFIAFFDFLSIWEGLGRVLGGFWKGFGRVWQDFFDVFLQSLRHVLKDQFLH